LRVVCGLFAGCLRVENVHYSSSGTRLLTRKQPANWVFGKLAKYQKTILRDILLFETTLCSSPQRLNLQKVSDNSSISRRGKEIRFRDLRIRPYNSRINHDANSKGAARKRGGSTL
jgi:hypothetical protein